jgi:hypothetical protein
MYQPVFDTHAYHVPIGSVMVAAPVPQVPPVQQTPENDADDLSLRNRVVISMAILFLMGLLAAVCYGVYMLGVLIWCSTTPTTKSEWHWCMDTVGTSKSLPYVS